ncbi:hypothetical protein [Brevundimonas sp. SL130]|uniref:hypothetical protein n=1 Tax=Brevundimonas sp. SL130 TaxID=2995143 RepID=UPI00226CA312|nr:hypothetical protein [Brevundimonas sp. SL130]WAC59210.1 hypothetical protein OU998_13425 [Brevundimonas sp. SL130]
MKKFTLGKALAAAAVAAVVGGPVTAAVWNAAAQDAPPAAASSAQLTVQLKAAITQTTASLSGRSITDAEAQAVYSTALQNVIVASGASPEVVAAALEAALAELRAEGTLPAAAAAAIQSTLAAVIAENQGGPAATGATPACPRSARPRRPAPAAAARTTERLPNQTTSVKADPPRSATSGI